MEKKDVILTIMFLIIPIIIYLIYTKPIHEKVNLFSDITLEEFTNCKKAPEEIQELIDNLTDYFNGIVYPKRFLLCVKKDKIYCLESKVEHVLKYNIVYFDELCETQKEIGDNLEFIIIDYEYAKNITKIEDFLNGLKIGKIKVSDKAILDALLNPSFS